MITINSKAIAVEEPLYIGTIALAIITIIVIIIAALLM